MFDAKRLLDQFLGGSAQDGRRPAPGRGGDFDLGRIARGALGGQGGGALAGGLAGLLLGSKSGRKMGGSAMKVGGLALIGGLAYKAYQDWQASQAAQQHTRTPAPAGAVWQPAPANTPFNPAGAADQQALGQSLLRAMIAAAKADGHIDEGEKARIFDELDRLGLDDDGKAFVVAELQGPLDVDAVARGARFPEEAAEIYTASLLAIDVDSAAERRYLADLATRLKLDDDLVDHLHETVEEATERA